MYTKQLTLYTLSFLLTIFVVIVLIYFVVNKKTPKISDLTNNLVSTSTDTNTPNIKNSNLNSGNYQNIEDYFNKNDFVNANKSIDAQLSNDPNNIQLLLFKATTLAQQGSLEFKEKELGDQARSYAEKALKLDPKNIQALTLIGYTYEIQQDYVNAHKYYDQALVIDPNNVDTLAQKAHAYDLQGKIDEAGKLYEKTIEIDPENTIAILGRAKIFAKQGELVKAKKDLLNSIDKIADNRHKAEIYYSLYIIAEKESMKNLVEQEKYISLTISTDESYPQGYVGRAKILFFRESLKKVTEIDEANINASFQDLSKAIGIYKNLSIAHIQLATQLSLLKDKQNAKLVLKNLPTIIDNDITLNSLEKHQLKKVVTNINIKNNL